MKRFPDASVIRYQLHRLFVTAMLAVAALALLAEVARAQTFCGEPEEQPAALLSLYVGELDLYFPAENATCEKFVRGATAACHRAVSDAAACRQRLAASLFKNTKTLCKDAIVPAQCSSDAEEANQGHRAAIVGDPI
jgi:hypothetical protein